MSDHPAPWRPWHVATAQRWYLIDAAGDTILSEPGAADDTRLMDVFVRIVKAVNRTMCPRCKYDGPDTPERWREA